MITENDVREAIFSCLVFRDNRETILDRWLGKGVDIRKVVGEIARHYLMKVLKESKKRTIAAELLGLPNYQTVNNRCKKYNLLEKL